MKCAETHLTTACTDNETIKCINCNQDHMANDIKCPVYAFKSKKINEQRQQALKYIAAPPPTNNAWFPNKNTSRASAGINTGRASASTEPQRHQEAPRIQDQGSFPPLTTTGAVPQQAQAQAAIPDITQVSELISAIDEIKNANFPEIIRFIKDFTKILAHPTQTERCTALMNFISQFNNYHF